MKKDQDQTNQNKKKTIEEIKSYNRTEILEIIKNRDKLSHPQKKSFFQKLLLIFGNGKK